MKTPDWSTAEAQREWLRNNVDELPAYKWKWPDGWLEKRRREIADKERGEDRD